LDFPYCHAPLSLILVVPARRDVSNNGATKMAQSGFLRPLSRRLRPIQHPPDLIVEDRIHQSGLGDKTTAEPYPSVKACSKPTQWYPI